MLAIGGCSKNVPAIIAMTGIDVPAIFVCSNTIALVQESGEIKIDADQRLLQVNVSDKEFAEYRAQ